VSISDKASHALTPQDLPTYFVVLSPYMEFEGRLLVNQHNDQAAKDRSSVIYLYVGRLAEKLGDDSVVRSSLNKLIDYSAQEHCFTIFRSPLIQSSWPCC
jgi:hypothetical protein